MALLLALPPELESRLQTEAVRRGITMDSVAVSVLDEQLPPLNRTEAAVKLLSVWAIEAEHLTDAEAESNVAVLRAIDRDRLSDRKLFTELLDEQPR